MNIKDMAEKWKGFCKKVGVKGDYMKYFEKIRISYLTPQRYYHTFEGHIGERLRDFEEVKNLCENPDLIYYAWKLHDIEQNPRASDNEERSAKFAYDFAIEMGLSCEFATRAKDLIISTKHLLIPETIDAKTIVDLDFLIFGKPEEEFDKYEQNIRKEYEWVPLNIYKKERAKILQKFLDRPTIFLTEFFREKYESQARTNLENSLTKF